MAAVVRVVSMSLRPFWNYYGGKWRVAPHYPPPRHETIVEPFAGAAGYATRYPAHQVVLVDADPVITGIWRWLIRADPSELLALPDLEAHQTVDDLEVHQEARWLIGFWLNSGSATPRKRMSTWAKRTNTYETGGGMLVWGETVRKRLAWQVTRIRHWKVIEGDYWMAPDLEADWFIDSPYQVAGKHYRLGSSTLDYPALGRWCRTRRGQVIVCENAGADWLPFEPWRSIKASDAKSGGKRSEEVVWLNPPPLRLFGQVEAQ